MHHGEYSLSANNEGLSYDYSSGSSPGNSPRDPVHMPSLQLPGNITKNTNNTFVHKLYNMVIDAQYQHLIAWSYTGSSFVVCNIVEFSRDVLPKHFKHNNFSSFVRQLNMYGFHKVNKSPKGHRTLAENQIWEFSHTKFLKDRPDLLEEIKRKTLETDTNRRDDVGTNMAMMQVSQTEMVQQLTRLQDNYCQMKKELEEAKYKQQKQQQLLKQMSDFLYQRHGIQMDLPTDLERPTPSIFITSHDTMSNNLFIESSRQRPALTVQTHSLSPGIEGQQTASPALSAYNTALNTPVSPGSTHFISDDDIPNIYTNNVHGNSPLSPNDFAMLQSPSFYPTNYHGS
ncbi:HSF-type DNA-binding-domain-containing protein [Sporodiniella umbellata]|nr:HSF-type DNA-binding-domain-containing protein [Sporodiniella umbellata]